MASELWLVRHGETEWSRARRHTSYTDVPLTEGGVTVAEGLRKRLAGNEFDLVLTSPMARARRTAELAGFADAVTHEDLVEWQYGDYEGMTVAEIRQTVPGWTVWTHRTPHGERAEEVATRLDRVLHRVESTAGRALAFGHAHALRGLAARWLGTDVTAGRFFRLEPATVSVLGYERETPVILRWNS